MKILLVLLCIMLAIPALLFFRDYYVKLKLQRLTWMKYNSIKAILARLSKGKKVKEPDILVIAQNPSLRILLYRAFEASGHSALFPANFYTEEKGAEAHMVNWLEFPTELGRQPDEIQLMKIVTLELAIRVHYYVFRFKTSKPRWAARFDWMLGACGPYREDSQPFDVPAKVFSRFHQAGLTTPEAEVQWVHENINPHDSQK